MNASRQQLETALQRANEIRVARAELKRKIASGELSMAQVICDPPAEARSWRVGEAIRSQRRWGVIRARNALAHQEIPETKPLGALTERQRRALAGELQR